MSVSQLVVAGLLAVAAVTLVLREFCRRLLVSYEYRWETFAVRGLRGRQLLHIRRSEIVSVTPLTLSERLAGLGRFKWLTRSGFAPRVVIRSNIAHAKPVVVSWEGRLIAGLRPEGCKLRPEESGSRG